MSGQLPFALMLGVLVWSGCSHGPAVAASGWHQRVHSSEAFGPATSDSTIERTADRNTSLLSDHRARHEPALVKPIQPKFPVNSPFPHSWMRSCLRDFADEVPKIPHPLRTPVGDAAGQGVMNGFRMRPLYMKQLQSNEPEVRTTTLGISGMSCGACVRHVTMALDGITGVVYVDVDLRANEASVEHLPQYVDAASLIAAIRDAGYAARVVDTIDDADPKLATPTSASCGCGCCGSDWETVGGSRSDLGTSTIG